MCLIVVAYKIHPRYPLIVAANRDEFLDRAADPAHFWSDHDGVLAGRDQRSHGTWMGVTRTGRFAAVTNHRDLRRPLIGGPSRGLLVRDALLGNPLSDEVQYEGYNLLHGPMDALRYRSNILEQDSILEPGIHGLSNAFLNTPWPKVLRAKRSLEMVVRSTEPDMEALFSLLADSERAERTLLPDTGLDPEVEHALSAIRIDLPDYGTRCSTVLLVDSVGRARFEERNWQTKGVVVEELHL